MNCATRPSDIAQAFEQSIVDAYGEHKQHIGFVTMVENESACPFPARVIGQDVQVVAARWPKTMVLIVAG